MKIKNLIFLFVLTFIFFIAVHSFAVVINTEKTAVVDIEQVFESYYKTMESREEIEIKKTQLNESLKYKQNGIIALESKYDAIMSTSTLTENKNKPDFKGEINKPELDNGMNKHGKNEGMNFNPEASSVESKDQIKQIDMFKKDSLEKDKEVLKKEIEDAKKEIKEYEEKTKNDIDNLEKDYLYNITGEIYEKVSFIARRAGYNVVFDKKELVYSGKSYDLTDLVIKEINTI